MLRGKIIKKRTKNRETLLRNLRKGKARLEARCQFEIIPYPLKFATRPQIHHLYADLVLMEHNDTFVIEASLYNNVKVYKHVQIVDYSNQKLIRVLMENKNDPPANCEILAQRIANSESDELRSWADPIKTYCKRYESLLEEFKKRKEEVSSQILQSYLEINDKTERTRQNLFRTYPCYELKYQFKDGQIQLTELIFNQKFINEIGYSLESFVSTVFQEGIPKMVPFEGPMGSTLAKIRVENHLINARDGYTSPETEGYLIMKSEYTKKIKFRHHFHSTYEKGVPGFSIFGTVVAKQKPVLDFTKSREIKINTDFIQFMAEKEKAADNFLSLYYDCKAEQKYLNFGKVCTIREIGNQEEV